MASFYENISGYTVTQTDKAYFTDIEVSGDITVNGVTVDLVTLADLVNTPTFTGSISSLGLSVGDNNLINVGAGNDLQIYHDGSHSYIKDAGTGDLKIQGGNVAIQNISGGNIFSANSQAAFLDWRGTSGAGTKLETTATGIDVTGTVTASEGVLIPESKKLILGSETDSAGLEIYEASDGDSLIKQYGDGNLIIKGQNILLRNNSDQTLISTILNTAQLYHRNGDNEGLKLETTNSGIDVTGTVTADGVALGDSEKIKLGASQDLEIYHNGSDSYIIEKGAGDLNIQSNGADIKLFDDANSVNLAAFVTGGAAKLYWAGNNAEVRLATTETGIDVTGTVTADGVALGDSEKIQLGASQDLELFHDGTNSYVQDAGDGGLILNTTSGNGVFIHSATETMGAFHTNGAVNLYHDNAEKFATTATGINVTGTVEADEFSGTGTVAITDFIDDDTFATASATNVPTAESVKAYVDANAGTTYSAGTGLTLDGATFNVDAAQTQITSVGALNAGSITSGFGDINNGTNSVTTNGVLISDSTSGDDTKPELKFYKDVNSATGDFIGEVVFESKDHYGVDRVFAEIRAQAKSVPTNGVYKPKGAIHFNIADGTGGGDANIEKPSCVIDSTGVRINSENSDGSLQANYFHVDNINLVTGTQAGGLKFNSRTQDDASNKTTRIISKNITEDHAISFPNVSGSLVVAAIAGGSINGGGGTTSPKSTWSESNFTANVNTTYIHYNPLNTTDLTVSPEYPSDGYGEFFKFLNASPQSSEIVIDLDGYSGSSVASYALTKTDGSLNTTINTSANSTITVASGGFVTLTKVAFAVYLVEGIGYTYS